MWRFSYAALAFTLTLFSTGCDSGDQDQPDQADLPVLPPVETSSGLDDDFAAVALAVPGFAGFYSDSDGVASMAMRSSSKNRRSRAALDDAVEAAIATVPRFERFRTRVASLRLVDVSYDFAQLHEWHRAIVEADPMSVGVRGSGVRQSENKIALLVEGDGDVARARTFALGLGVPDDALMVEVAGPPVSQQSQTLRSEFSPDVPAGVQFTDPQRGGSCTVGFNLVVDGTRNKFFSNSHCTVVFGGYDDFHYVYQPTSFGERFAFEAFDRSFRSSSPGCPSGRLCRTSDAAVFQYAAGTRTPEYAIARPQALNSSSTAAITVNSGSPRLQTFDYLNAFEGDIVMMIGRTSGWRSGVVRDDDAVVYGPGNLSSTYMLTRQVLADYSSSDGDSGAPVFIAITGNAGDPYNGTTTNVDAVSGVFPVGIHVGQYGFSGGRRLVYFSDLQEAVNEVIGDRTVSTRVY